MRWAKSILAIFEDAQSDSVEHDFAVWLGWQAWICVENALCRYGYDIGSDAYTSCRQYHRSELQPVKPGVCRVRLAGVFF
jgi:hypothetical protein